MMPTSDSNNCQVDLAEYLFTRLHQVGVRTVQGVPGDYNLVSLDYIEPAGLQWAGNANELNAGYAADGYARIKGISVLVTTFGVGELSALNAVGGAYAEKAPVIHIVGAPPTTAQNKCLNLHHSFGDGNFRRFALVYEQFTCAQANLVDPATAPAMIDRVIRQCLLESRPVYIEFPTDMVKAKVSSLGLNRSIDLSVGANDSALQSSTLVTMLDRIGGAKKPLIIVDGFTSRYDLLSESDELIRATGWPTYVTPFGKGSVNETYTNFHGVYVGKAGEDDAHRNWVTSCDLVIRFAPLDVDTNTFSFTALPDVEKCIDIHRDWIDISGDPVQINTKLLLRKILDKLNSHQMIPYPSLPKPQQRLDALSRPNPTAPIDQETFWLRMSTFLRPHDIIITETGTSSFGGNDLILPPNTTMINSALWLSIGYALGAAVGTSCAQRDLAIETQSTHPAGRTILFQGDGSFQMTAQSISDIFRNKLNVTIFLINNDGYTIERHIHGMNADYNSIHPWDYLDAPRFFGAPRGDPEYPVVTRRVENWGALWGVLGDERVKSGKGFCMVEVVMGREDAPVELMSLVKMAARRNEGA